MKRALIFLTATLFLTGAFSSLSEGQVRKETTIKAGLSAESRAAIMSIGDNMRKLDQSHANFVRTSQELGAIYYKLSAKVGEVSRLAAAGKSSQDASGEKLLDAIREMQKMQQSFNMEFHKLQESLQKENRQFNMISNTIHDSAKSVIQNLR